jgi:hypothetical protein|tara:strand:+ start:3318 stop:3824 length:507 start_codon:yes stop_codon:yes gene_type:complete
MQKLAKSVAEMSDQMSIEQQRLYTEYVTKSLEAREAEEAFFAAAEIETTSDSKVADTLRDIRGILQDQKYRLSGSEAVLLASMSKLLEGDEYLDTKRLNILLHSFDRKPSNTTKIVDTLDKKSLMETRSDGLHSHKTFRLSRRGEDQVSDLLAQLNRSTGSDRLAVVD